MPEVNFRVRWPDDSENECYSPSTVIRDYLKSGDRFTVSEFAERARAGLGAASERVRERFGFACSSAMGQLGQIEQQCSRFDSNTIVEIVSVN
jgi:uncharacterized repeat protein (TIGR04042 family)